MMSLNEIMKLTGFVFIKTFLCFHKTGTEKKHKHIDREKKRDNTK